MISIDPKIKGNLYIFKQFDQSNHSLYLAPAINFFTDCVHLGIVSGTGAGKSIVVKLIFTTMARNSAYQDTELIILDPKNFEYRQFGVLPNVFLGEKVIDGLDYIYERFENRLSGKEPSTNLLCVLVEEYSALLLHYDKKTQDIIKGKIARILMLSRALNLRCIFVMQRFDSIFFQMGLAII